MQNYFVTDFVVISYNKVNHVIVLKWEIPPTSAEFREAMNSLISAMEYFNTGDVIADTMFLGMIHPHDQQWAATVWFEKALKVGYSKLAIIIPDEIFTQMSVEDTMNKTNPTFSFAYFDDMTSAEEWITKA